MKKLKNYILNKLVDYKIKQLTKVRFVAANSYTTYWNETGEKTFGRFDMFEALHCAMFKVYGPDWNLKTRINGFKFTEDKNGLYLTVWTHKPGQLIGKMGEKINELEKVLSLIYLKDTHINIEETPELYGVESHEDY